jgi:CheY-like chemotaxis protein
VAVDKFIAHPYDLVFMDVQMPEPDGLDATRMIREWEREQGIVPAPIIALTASVLDEDIKRFLGAGFTAHISKPFKKQIILDVIRAASTRSLGVQRGRFHCDGRVRMRSRHPGLDLPAAEMASVGLIALFRAPPWASTAAVSAHCWNAWLVVPGALHLTLAEELTESRVWVQTSRNIAQASSLNRSAVAGRPT